MDSPPSSFLPTTSSPLNGKMLVVAVVVLAAVIVMILVMHLYAKWMWSGVSARQISMTRRQRAMGLVDAARATLVTHGLDRAVIEALGTFKHSIQGDGKKDRVTECAVCLCEFEDGENGRLLPKCKHSFHVDCIDMWLHSNTTCPICRASVQVEGERTESQEAVHGSGITILSQVAANLEDQQLGNGIRIVQFPNNVLYWGNQLQCNAQTISASNSGSAPSMSGETSSSTAAPSHVTIDIPTGSLTVDIPPRPIPASMFTVGGEEASTASPGTTKSQNSGPLVTPGGRLRSLRRLLSRERRPTTSSDLPLEDSDQSSIRCQQQESQ